MLARMGLAQAVQVLELWRSRYQLSIRFGICTGNNLMSVYVKKRLLRCHEELSKFLHMDFLKLARLGGERQYVAKPYAYDTLG